MTYTEFIRDQLKDVPTGKPIYTKIIAEELAKEYNLPIKEAAAATAVAFKRIIEDKSLSTLRFYQKGIYYFTQITPFGEVGINKEQLIADKYILPDNGYEAGFTFLHQIGLTTQIPKERLLVTNKATNCTRKDKNLNVTLRPPKTTITQENKIYLQILDAMDFMDKAPVDVEKPYLILNQYIKKKELKYETLLSFADQFYNNKTLIHLAHTAREGGIK